MKLKLFYFFVFICLVFNTYSKTSVKETMGSIFEGFAGLMPYVSSPMKFKDPKNKEQIHTHLLTIENAFKRAKHVKTFKLPGMSPSYEQVKEHLKETLVAFELGQSDFARLRVRATSELCISCHTQLKTNSLSFINTAQRDHFKSDLDYADFLFLVRSYKRALRYYEKGINLEIENSKELSKLKKRKGSTYVSSRVDDSFEKILIYYTKVNYDPAKAISFLSRYLKENELRDEVKRRLKAWIHSLQSWDKRYSNKKELRKVKLDELIKKELSPYERGVPLYEGDHEVVLLISSGIFYRDLMKNSSPNELARDLFWMSKIEKLLSKTYLFSLSELYLKECITKYSKTNWAPLCFKAYKDQITHGYTGSAGTSIPLQEKKEIKRLEKFILK